MSQEIVLFGLAQIADIIQYYLHKYTDYKVVARCVDKEYITSTEYNGLPVISFDEVEKVYSPKNYKMAIPMYHTRLNKIREKKYIQAKEKGYSFISYISPQSIIDTCDIGENTFITGLVSIQPFTKIGNNCMIWSGTTIGHHCVINDNCFIAVANIAGCVTIENNTTLGNGALIANGVHIGKYSFIGMGSNILKRIPDYSVVSVKNSKIWEISSLEGEDLLL